MQTSLPSRATTRHFPLAAIIIVLLAIVVNLQASAALARHKVQVTNPAAARQIVASGGRLIADYGAFQLYETTTLPPNAEVRDTYNTICLNATHLDTTTPAVQALRKNIGAFTGKRLHLVHFAGPLQPAWRDALLATGSQIVTYIPQNAYLIYGDAPALARVQTLAAKEPRIQWEGSYLDDYKIHPAARAVDSNGHPRAIGTDQFSIQLVADDDANPATLKLLDNLKLQPFPPAHRVLDYMNTVVRLNAADVARIASQPDVVSIQPYYPPRKVCERQDQIVAGNLSGNTPSGPGYLAWLESKGFTQPQFTTSGFTVDVSDSGIDNGTTSPNHFGLYAGGVITGASRVIYNRLQGTPNSGSTLHGCDGHGTINSHIIGGYDNGSGFPFADSSGYHYGLGVCPFVRLGSSVVFDPDNWTSPDFSTLQSDAYQNGARVSNNSWGDSGDDSFYSSDSQEYDALVRDAQASAAGNQEMIIVFAAGNDGPSSGTVCPPGTAKNVITVGGADNVQPFNGSDQCGISDDDAANANAIVSFSGRGPCSDGRMKPDLVAPATHVSGGVPQASNPGPDGTVDSCFTADGICGGEGTNNFFPSGQQFYSASSGTSHSTPCVSGGCALVRQYFINHDLTPPSPAMTKAFLMNSARYMTGSGANDNLWSQSQGMGEMDLGVAFDGVPRVLSDEKPSDTFTATGQSRTYIGSIASNNLPFRVTVAWTDAPGNTTGNAFNNDLDLTVTVGGNTYKGNVFSNAFSITGGTADVADNVESVFLPAGVSGDFVVTVTAANINSIGVPNNNNALEQDFALIIYNAAGGEAASIVGAGATLTAESCTPTNGVIDPGETVSVNFALQNNGSVATSNLVATLLSGTGVTSPSSAVTLGVVPAGATTNATFSFTATGTCGGAITTAVQLADNFLNMGAVNNSFQLGQYVATLLSGQNFDAVTAPALPSGWSSVAAGAQSKWFTVSTNSYSAPNSAFCAASVNPGVAELDSPAIHISSSSARLVFHHAFSLEENVSEPTNAFDGGVLEIEIGTNGFEDILTAGATFAAGAYNATISSDEGTGNNYLAGRQAWSGYSAGFITTVVNLPAAANNQDIRLKWRCGTDSGNFYTSIGWWVDSISISNGAYVCCDQQAAPAILDQPLNQATPIGGSAAFTVLASGAFPLYYQWANDGAPLPGRTNTSLVLTNLAATNAGSYTVVVSNSFGSVTSTVAVLAVGYAPAITNQPASQSVAMGSPVTFNVGATGNGTLAYQWWFNASPLAAQNGASLAFNAVSNASAGSYFVVVTNLFGAATSRIAVLTVLPPPVGSLTVTVSPAAAVTAGAKWQVDGGAFFSSGAMDTNLSPGNHSLAFKTIPGWYTPAAQTVSITNAILTAAAGIYSIVDQVRPTNAIKSPASGLHCSNTLFTASGTASDNVAVAGVFYQLNNGSWTPASSSNGFTNWTAQLQLTPGTNTLAAYAVDTSTNFSATNRVSFVCVILAPLTVQTNGFGSFTPKDNGALLQVGSTYHITATPGAGTVFSNWSGGVGASTVLATKPALSFVMQSNLVLTATFTDGQSPTLTISAPTSLESFTNVATPVTGTAHDNVAVSNVFVSLNGGSWTAAVPGTNWSHWTNVSPPWPPGTNLIQAYAVDTSGNLSKTTSVKAFYATRSLLTLVTNGPGRITRSFTTNLLYVGRGYSVTAVPSHNFILSNWVGGTALPYPSLTNGVTCNFLMRSNLVLQANFVTNLFLAAAGPYHGLFAPVGAARAQSNSGGFTLNLTTSGSFSGNLLVGMDKVSLSGQFDAGGRAEITSPRKGESTLATTLQLDLANDAVSGEVGDGIFRASLAGDQDVFNSTVKAVNFAGQYTLVLPGSDDPGVGPYGTSYGTVSVSESGAIVFTGNLADGTSLSQSSVVSRDGLWPMYVPLYGGKGSLWGWIGFSNKTILALPSASWINATNPATAAAYRTGFTNQQASLASSAYVSTNTPLLNLTAGTVTLSGGGLPDAITNHILMSAAGRITVTNAAEKSNGLSLTISKATGVITGSFVNPANSRKTLDINGVLLQSQTNAAGYFLNGSNSGSFGLHP